MIRLSRVFASILIRDLPAIFLNKTVSLLPAVLL